MVRKWAVSQTARQTYITTFGAGLNAFLGFIFTIIIARALSPQDFGVFAVITSLIIIFVGFTDLGTISGAFRFLPGAPIENKPKIKKIIFLIVLTTGSLLTFLLFLMSDFTSQIIFKSNNFSLLFKMAAPAVLGLSLWAAGYNILYAEKNFIRGIVVDTSSVIFKLVCVFLLLITFRLNLPSTTLAFSLTPFLSILLFFLFVSPDFILDSVSKTLVKQIFAFSSWIFLSKIAITILGQIDTIMLARFADSLAAGIYAAANRITFVFPVLANGLSVVITPHFAGLSKTEEAKIYLKKVMAVMGLFLVPVVVLYFLSDLLVVWLYGPAYSSASFVFRLLLLRTAFYLIATGPLTTLVYFFGDSKTFAFVCAAQLLMLVIFNVLFIPGFGAAGPALAGAVAYGVIFVASGLIVLRKFKNS